MTEHLTSRQIARYHERELDTQEIIELDEHLATCANCRKEFNAAAKGEGTLFSPQPPVETIHDVPPQSIPNRFSAYSNSIFRFKSPGAAFGMGALAMLVVVTFVWLIVRVNRTGSTGPQVVPTSAPAPMSIASPDPGAKAGASPSPTPSPSPQILMALTDGAKQVGIDEQGKLIGLEDLAPGSRELVKTALITQQVANLGALAGLGGRQGVLSGGKNQSTGFVPLSPVGKVVFSTKPTVRWSKLDGASEYRVEIYGPGLDLVASSPPLKSNSWDVPNELNRGEIYSWHVTATKDGAKVKTPVPPAPEAKFKTVDLKQAAELTAARKSFSSSHLTLGVLYAQAGLLDEAEREFNALLGANPQSEIARNLLNNVRAARSATMK